MKYLQLLIAFSVSFILSCNNAQKNNPADKTLVREASHEERKIEIKVFSNDTIAGSGLTGFGYDIIVDGMRIHQPHIPAISGTKGFATAGDAQRTAEYVCKKLKETNSMPALSKEELDSLKIKY